METIKRDLTEKTYFHCASHPQYSQYSHCQILRHILQLLWIPQASNDSSGSSKTGSSYTSTSSLSLPQYNYYSNCQIVRLILQLLLLNSQSCNSSVFFFWDWIIQHFNIFLFSLFWWITTAKLFFSYLMPATIGLGASFLFLVDILGCDYQSHLTNSSIVLCVIIFF